VFTRHKLVAGSELAHEVDAPRVPAGASARLSLVSDHLLGGALRLWLRKEFLSPQMTIFAAEGRDDSAPLLIDLKGN
jgi:hypothetical protein